MSVNGQTICSEFTADAKAESTRDALRLRYARFTPRRSATSQPIRDRGNLSSRRVRLRGLVEQKGGHLRLTESAVAMGVRTEPGTFDSVGPGSERVILGVQEEW